MEDYTRHYRHPSPTYTQMSGQLSACPAILIHQTLEASSTFFHGLTNWLGWINLHVLIFV